LHRDACGLRAQLFAGPALFPDEPAPRPLEKCYPARRRLVQTLLGEVEVRRRDYHHPPSHTGRAPLDERLAWSGVAAPPWRA
jgi:hypothetical protein